jgi:hypothetical protein
LLQLESLLLLLLAGDGCHGETEMQAGKGSAEKIREEKKTARSGQGRAVRVCSESARAFMHLDRETTGILL